MFKFLDTWNDKYKDLYKNDEFIEWGNIQENFFQKHKEDFLSILNTYYSLQNEYGEVDLDINSKAENSLIKNINWELKNLDSFDFLLTKEWKINIDVSYVFTSFLVKVSIGYISANYSSLIFKNMTPGKVYSSSDSIWYKKIFSSNDKEIWDILDWNKKIYISNFNDLEKVIKLYEKIIVKYLFFKYKFEYNKVDNSFYKTLSFSDTWKYSNFFHLLKHKWIIKDFYYNENDFLEDCWNESDNKKNKNPLDIIKVWELELKNVSIDLLRKKVKNKYNLSIRVDDVNLEIINFLKESYFLQKDIIINQSKAKIVSILSAIKKHDNLDELNYYNIKIITKMYSKVIPTYTHWFETGSKTIWGAYEPSLLELFDDIEVYEFWTWAIEIEKQKYNLHLRAIIEKRKDKMFSKKIIQKDMEMYEELLKERREKREETSYSMIVD